VHAALFHSTQKLMWGSYNRAGKPSGLWATITLGLAQFTTFD